MATGLDRVRKIWTCFTCHIKTNVPH